MNISSGAENFGVKGSFMKDSGEDIFFEAVLKILESFRNVQVGMG